MVRSIRLCLRVLLLDHRDEQMWLRVMSILAEESKQCYLDLMTLTRKPWLKMLRFERLKPIAYNKLFASRVPVLRE